MNRTWVDRLLWAIVGLVWFLWLGYEDRTLGIVMVVACLLAVRFLMTAWLRWVAGAESWGERAGRSAALGALLGASVPALAALLIMMKVSLHSHPEPDFNLMDIRALLIRTPVWALVGLLVGASLGLMSKQGKASHVAPPRSVAYNEVDLDDSQRMADEQST